MGDLENYFSGDSRPKFCGAVTNVQALKNLSYLDFDLSKSLKVKSDGTVALPI